MCCRWISSFVFVLGFVCGSLAINKGRSCSLSLPENVKKTGNATSEKIVAIPSGEHVTIQCIEDNHVFASTKTTSLSFVCQGGEDLSQGLECVNVSTVETASRATSALGTLVVNGQCERNATNIDVHVVKPGSRKSYVIYSVCFLHETCSTLYSKSYLDGELLANVSPETGRRPNFQDPTPRKFPFQVANSYTWDEEEETINRLLGPEMFDVYFPSRQYQLNRGHLFPNADSVYQYQRRSTFFYINVVPQWQILNGGNWKYVEDSVRDLAASLESTLTIWTGTHGVLSLKDIQGKNVEIWLATHPLNEAQKLLPAPKFLWKVVHSVDKNAAIAIVQLNNPWGEVSRSSTLCKDICEDISWFKLTEEQRYNPRKGYTYCCDVNELAKVIDTVPKSLRYSGILNEEVEDYDLNEKNKNKLR